MIPTKDETVLSIVNKYKLNHLQPRFNTVEEIIDENLLNLNRVLHHSPSQISPNQVY